MDNDLDFPLKLDGLVRAASGQGIPVHFSACGVSGSWSNEGKELFNYALKQAATVTVRDRGSAKNLFRHLAMRPTAVTQDPAVWAQQVYGYDPQVIQAGNRIGLGIMNPETINRRRAEKERFSPDALIQFWEDLALKLTLDGFTVELFTNGDVGDQSYAESVRASLAAKSHDVRLVTRSTTPTELAHTISRYEAIVAFRLHASIVAFSYGIPSIGLVWNDKVQEFYQESGRSHYSLMQSEYRASIALQKLYEALQDGVDNSAIEASRRAALSNIFVVQEAMGQAAK